MRQLVAFVVFGVFLSGPLGHAWLRFLNGHKTSLKGQSLILYKVRWPLSRAAHVTCNQRVCLLSGRRGSESVGGCHSKVLFCLIIITGYFN